MRAYRTLVPSAAFASILGLAGCGEDPRRDTVATESGKGDRTIQRASEKSEIKAFAPGTGYKGEGDGRTAPEK
jgi:hypothetical protein